MNSAFTDAHERSETAVNSLAAAFDRLPDESRESRLGKLLYRWREARRLMQQARRLSDAIGRRDTAVALRLVTALRSRCDFIGRELLRQALPNYLREDGKP